MKKFTAVLLAVLMVFSMSLTAFAAGEKGSITIENADPGQTYSAFRIADLIKYDADSGIYLYKASSAWVGFFSRGGAGMNYVEEIEVEGELYLNWKTNESAESVKGFIDAALDYAEQNSISPTATVTAVKDEETVISNLDLGYYLVKSTLGTILSLDTVDPDVTMQDKNGIPTVDKKIVDSDKTEDTNTAKIGDVVKFQTTVTVEDGALNYVLYDTMTEGFTFDPSSVVVKCGGTTLTDGDQYTLTVGTDADSYTFKIAFKDAYIATVEGEVITVDYSAALNEKAVIADAGNPNETYLTYGENNTESNHDKTVTYSYQFQLVKTTAKNKILQGAEFSLYGVQEGGEPIALVDLGNGVYRLATADDTTTTTVIVAGTPEIRGLANGTYYLEETKAPALTYNILKERVPVVIEDANKDATLNAEDNSYVSGGVQVINNTGLELPSTGGIGTTIFYVFGGLLVVAAGIFFVVKKRMSMEKA